MYLGHHYVVDLVGGGAYAVIAFWIASYFLPSVLPPQRDPEHFLYSKARKGVHDPGEAMDHREKQILFRAHDDDDVDDDNNDNETDSGDSGSSSSSGGSKRSGRTDKAWDLEQQNDEENDFTMNCGADTIEMNSVVVSIPTRGELEIIAEDDMMTRSEPSSPTDSHHSSTSSASSSSSTTVSSWIQRVKKQNGKRTTPGSHRQSWNGWQGYESWVEVLATVNSPRTSPKTSPGTSPIHSPRSSTTTNPQGSPF